MDEAIDAITLGDYKKAIAICNAGLEANADDGSAHYLLAIAYENTGRNEEALEHIVACLETGRDVFEYLLIAVRCAKELGDHEGAYEYAERALNTKYIPVLPKAMKKVFSVAAMIPRLRGINEFSTQMEEEYKEQMVWLEEYVDWYKQQYSPNK